MHYYKLIIEQKVQYENNEVVYYSKERLPIGTIATVWLRNKKVIGMISGICQDTPEFTVRELTPTTPSLVLQPATRKFLQRFAKYNNVPLHQTINMICPIAPSLTQKKN